VLLNKGRRNKVQLEKALYVFQQCIVSDPNGIVIYTIALCTLTLILLDFRAYYNAALVYDAIANLDDNNDNLNRAIDSLNKAIDIILCNDNKDTDDNSKLSLMYGQRANYFIRLKSPRQAYDSCNEGLKYNSVCIVCISNINVCMRQLGLMKEAIALTWRLLNLQNELLVDDNVNCDTNLNIQNELLVDEKSKYNITIYCVKWGTKYNADYVNHLYRDLKKNINNDQTNKEVSWSMICFTEDDNEIRSEITCLPFPDDTKAWTGWWLKTSIFQNYHNHNDNDDTTINLNLYLDLDVCICGSLSFIIDLYDNNYNDNIFYTLGAEHLKSEGRPCGINSSFILWKNNDLNIKWFVLYDFLVLQYQTLVSGVYKFDHYLEMMLLGEIKVIYISLSLIYIY